MTTFTSNNNMFAGKTHSEKQSFSDKYDYSKPSNGGGCLLVVVLIVVAIVLFTVVIPNLS